MKTSKSQLMHELEKGATTTISVLIPFVAIFDGMVLVQIFKCTGRFTYNEFADGLLVNFNSKVLLAHLRFKNGVPFSQMETIKQS